MLALAALLPGAAGAATLYGLIDSGELFASTNAGVSWTVRSTLPVRDAVALAAGGSSSELFLASESGGLYRSIDAGLNWTALSAVAAADVTAMVPAPGQLLLLATSGSVYASTDGGVSFGAAGVIAASNLVSATRQGGFHFALTRTGEVYRSADGGVTWSAVGAIATSGAVEIVGLDGNLHVLTATGDLARSTDQGASWTFVSTLSQSGMAALAVGNGELLAATRAGETAASATGTTWTWRGVIGQLEVRALALDTPTMTAVEHGARAPLAFAAPWPNPASRSVVFTLELERESMSTIEVFDASGRRVAVPVAEQRVAAGRFTRVWSPGDLPSGAYFARARVDGVERTRGFVWLGER
jgi:hypothetical protein